MWIIQALTIKLPCSKLVLPPCHRAASDHGQLSQTGTCVRGGGVYAAPVRIAHTQSKRFLKVASIIAREEVAAPCTIADSVE